MKNSSDMNQHLLRADVYRCLALALDDPSDDRLTQLADLCRDVTPVISDDILRYLFEQFSTIASSAMADDIVFEYHRLFTAQTVCLFSEGSYHRTDRGAILADIAAFYQAFHVRVPEGRGAPDAIKVELGFMSIMALKSANALTRNDVDALEVTACAERQFLLDHLGRFSPVFVAELIATTNHPFYRAITHLLKHWITLENSRFAITPHALGRALPSANESSIGGEDLQCAL